MSKTAYQRFEETMGRCDSLLELYDTVQSGDLLRQAVVLCVAGLDMYAMDRFLENFTEHMRGCNFSKKEIKFLEDCGVTLEMVLRLLKEHKKGKHPFREIRRQVERHYASDSFQRFDKIDGIFANYGLKNISGDALRKTGRKTLEGKIRKMLERRHAIVHECDYDTNGKVREIEKRQVADWRKAIGIFVESMEEILELRFGKGKKRKSGKTEAKGDGKDGGKKGKVAKQKMRGGKEGSGAMAESVKGAADGRRPMETRDGGANLDDRE